MISEVLNCSGVRIRSARRASGVRLSARLSGATQTCRAVCPAKEGPPDLASQSSQRPSRASDQAPLPAVRAPRIRELEISKAKLPRRSLWT